jgi:ribonuclease-3
VRTTDQTKLLTRLQKKLGVEFKNRGLLQQALTHRSVQGESRDDETMASNERLEFLGDAVLGLVVGQHLYELYPSNSEGDLTRIKAAAVSEITLSQVAGKLGLGQYVHLSKGEVTSGGRDRPSILADSLEAVIGAVFLDHGLKKARDLIVKLLRSPLRVIARQQHEKDYKTLLQEVLQARHKSLPTYRVAEVSGPDHDRTFVMEARFARRTLGRGAGKSKKEAEQAAAKQAVANLADEREA